MPNITTNHAITYTKTSWKMRTYGIYARVNVVDVSEIERVRFLIHKQRVRKYRTPALSACGIAYYIHTETVIIVATFLFQIFPI